MNRSTSSSNLVASSNKNVGNKTPKQHLQQSNSNSALADEASSFVQGTWNAGGSVSTSSNAMALKIQRYQEEQQQQKHQQQQNLGNSSLSFGTRNAQPKGIRTTPSTTLPASKAPFSPKITFPIFNPISFGQSASSGENLHHLDHDQSNSTFLTSNNNNNNQHLAASPSQDNFSVNNSQLLAMRRPYTVEAAGNVPLVGEWLAQRRFLLFPRTPSLRDSMWCWALLKSYVLRKDCMDEVISMRKNSTLRRRPPRHADGSKLSRQQQSPAGSFRIASPTSSSSPQQQKRLQATKKVTTSEVDQTPSTPPITALPILKNDHDQDLGDQNTSAVAAVAFFDENEVSPIHRHDRRHDHHQSVTAATPQPYSSNRRRHTPPQEQQQHVAWTGTPSRNLRQQQQQTTPNPQQKYSGHNMFSACSPSPSHCSPTHVLSNPKNSLASNTHVSKLRQAVVMVEKRKMWYEKFDASRRSEREVLSEKRQREAANKNAIKEWTWEEDEMLMARRLEQEERNALAKRLAREKLERIQHASKSLGIGAPIVMADFSYLKLTYFFELLAHRPRNPQRSENVENTKLLKFDASTLDSAAAASAASAGTGASAAAGGDDDDDDDSNRTAKRTASATMTANDRSGSCNHNDDAETQFECEEQQEKLGFLLNEDSFTRHVLDNLLVAALPDDVDKKRRSRPEAIVKTSNGIRVEDLSTRETFSDLLKLYRRYLVAENINLDIWKEEDIGFTSASASAFSAPSANTASSSSSSSPSSSAIPGQKAMGGEISGVGANKQNHHQHHPHLHPGDKNFHHFPTNIDKVSQRFYARFLALDFGQERLRTPGIAQNDQRHHHHHHHHVGASASASASAASEKEVKKMNSIVSSAYIFDTEIPPQLPYINALKLNGNSLVDTHVVQFPNGTWRSPPGPVSSFHDMTFVLTIRCPLWRLTLVSLDLSENLLTQLPVEVVEIPRLHSLFLHGNQFTSLSSLEALSAKRGEQMLRLSLYENPVIDALGLRDYTNRVKFMFPLLSHLDNVYIPCCSGGGIEQV